MKDLFSNGAYFPNNEAEVCSKMGLPKVPTDGHGHDECRIGAEAAHRLYFKDRDKPLINEGKQS